MLTNQQIEQYKKDGYTVVRQALPKELLDDLRRITDEIVASAKGLTEHTPVLDLEPSHTPENPRVRRIKTPQLAHPFYRELAGHECVMSVLRPLLGNDIRLRAGCKINMKSAGFGSPVEWHQDWAFYPHTNDDVLASGILLDDMDESNGPIMFLPGSHRGQVYDHHSAGAFCGAIDTTAEDLDTTEAIPVYGKAGDMTIHHARLVHGSMVNRSAKPRRVLFYEYTAADAWPLAGVEHLDDVEGFNSRIVSGEPTLRPRMANVPVKVPLPRAPYQGSIYENQRTLENRYFERAAD